jgi:hypothetical protein
MTGYRQLSNRLTVFFMPQTQRPHDIPSASSGEDFSESAHRSTGTPMPAGKEPGMMRTMSSLRFNMTVQRFINVEKSE